MDVSQGAFQRRGFGGKASVWGRKRHFGGEEEEIWSRKGGIREKERGTGEEGGVAGKRWAENGELAAR